MQLPVNFAIEEDVKKLARARNEPLASVGVKLDILNCVLTVMRSVP